MNFAIAAVPATKISEDGQTITLRVQDAQGAHLDLEAKYTALEEIANALNEASAKAHRARRMLSTVDEGVTLGEVEPFALKGYRFSVAENKSVLLLQLDTSTGRVDISLPKAAASEFVKDAGHSLALLAAPQQLN